jgi:diguanylate cyclase (GGDEF)-like protein
MDAFISIPIVFLSGETRVDKQLMAIGLGGDDFLTKPIEVEHLISSVTSRIKRSLMLRSFMIRDSLTGLLNHTAIKDKLLHELALANRLEKPISFAMVDIDHFKSVNDTYGHPVGDRVIKSLARMLKQRLRSCDLIGRYGGEEFAVILIDAHASSALKILDRIREDFSQLKFIGKEGQEFSVSFSGGVADISMFNDASKLIDASDKALYKAKHVGRNQLKIASAKSS